ncbi:MAG TPA: RNA polymerase subunit sigma-70, partial [Sphingobacterium sp.]|nr:RNA polymerase subunit sigma-70 [Sphingobacterium sp.]
TTEESPSSARLFRFLEIAGRKCLELLKSFYYDQMSLQEIADEYGYSGVRSATVQKFKCLEKVRESVKEKSLVYDDW